MNWVYWIFLGVEILAALGTAGHALLFKRDSRSALGWVAVCLFFPLMGPLLYLLFGINRVRTRARKLDQRWPFRVQPAPEQTTDTTRAVVSSNQLPADFFHFVQVSESLATFPLVGGNRIDVLHNGEAAYPAMLDAIENAHQSVYLATYILYADGIGLKFIDALTRAMRRGVDVRVLIDGIGELYSVPRAGTVLKKNKVPVARFIPPKLFPPTLHINLRNHRKVLIVDGRTGFTGGMNIGDRHLVAKQGQRNPIVDVHFRLSGAVVKQIEKCFLDDWFYCTGVLSVPVSEAELNPGNAICRTLVDGPNEDLDTLATILMGAVSAARQSIAIMTPYFLPSRELIAAFKSAALRGVKIRILLPAQNNLPFVQWASTNMLWELLKWGIRIYYQPPPFVHTKLFLADEIYALVGSANIDARSLRLNFELMIEILDRPSVQALCTHFGSSLAVSREISFEDVEQRPLLIKTRDALAWLFSPYL